MQLEMFIRPCTFVPVHQTLRNVFVSGLGLQGFVLLTLFLLLVPRCRHLTLLSRDGYNKFDNDPYSSDGGLGYGSTKSSWEPSFSSWRTKADKESSYLGFHRPTRVVPPSSSSLSHSTFSPGLIYPDRYSYIIPPVPTMRSIYPPPRPYQLSARHQPPLGRTKFTEPYSSYNLPSGYRVSTGPSYRSQQSHQSPRDKLGDYYF